MSCRPASTKSQRLSASDAFPSPRSHTQIVVRVTKERACDQGEVRQESIRRDAER